MAGIEQYWWLIALGVALAVSALVWLIRSSRTRSPEATTRDGVEHEVSPIIIGTPADIPPPIAAVPLVPEPEAFVAMPTGPADELTRMKGVGPKVAALLNSLGVTRYDQIASWGDADVSRVDAHLGAFKGRIARDQWVEQARFLAAGDTAGYEAKFGKLG